jgi:sugar (pentulose or hexulose) kinase
MKQDVHIGIDLGTTALKVAAFRPGVPVPAATVTVPLPVLSDAEGKRELDPEQVRQALHTAIRSVWTRLPDLRVQGLGLSAQGGSGMVVDRDSGAPLTPMVLWNDARTGAHTRKVAGMMPEAYWFELGLLSGPGAGLGRILWFREQYPGSLDRDRLYVGAGEFVFHLLTGVWRQDAGNAVQIGCYRVRTREIDAEPLALVGCGTEQVAPMRRGHEVHGLQREAAEWLGIPEGTPVAGPYMDHEAGYLAAVQAGTRPLQVSLGTAGVGHYTTPTLNPAPDRLQLVLPSPVTDSEWLVVAPLRTGSPAWDWAVTVLADEDRDKGFARADAWFRERLLPPPGLVTLPWLPQPNPWCEGAFGAGAVLGLSPHTSRADLLRATALGLCLELDSVLGHVRREGLVDRLVVGGGAMRTLGFPPLLAALFAPLPCAGLRDQEVAGARGTLYAFGPELAASAQKDYPPPDPALLADLEQRRTFYAELRNHLLRNV